MASRVSHYPSSQIPNLAFPPKTSRPGLRFARNLFTFAKFSHPPTPQTNHLNRLPQPGSGINRNHDGLKRLSHIRCFRCGDRGHVVKNCYVQVRCFNGGGAGHKRFRCFKTPSFRSTFPLEAVIVRDDSCVTLNSKRLESQDKLDTMLLDPDVIACYEGISDLATDSIADSKSLQSVGLAAGNLFLPMEDSCSQGSVEEDLSPCPISASVSVGCSLLLDLNPVPFSLFSDFIIDDEFEDYISDVEEDSGNLPCRSAMYSSSMEASHSNGKEIWAHMDQPKFIFYCRFQAVDGFARLERARARGSNTLSPFKSKTSKVSSNASSHDQEQDLTVSSRNSPKTNKRGQRPIMLYCVRRSPRLNKDIAGQK